jgi:hypothetical protein
MGNALIAIVVPEENLAYTCLRYRDEHGELVALPVTYSRAERERILAEHPGAHWTIEVRPADVWELPEQEHDAPASLGAYLDRAVARLEGMARRSYVLGRLRVAVSR